MWSIEGIRATVINNCFLFAASPEAERVNDNRRVKQRRAQRAKEQTMQSENKRRKRKTTSYRSGPSARADLVARRPTAAVRTRERLRRRRQRRAPDDGTAERPDTGSGAVRAR